MICSFCLICIGVMIKKVTDEKEFIPLVLPSDNKQLQTFINNNMIVLMEKVISSIEYAVSKNLPIVETFLFKDTEFIITINSHTFKENLDNIYEYYIKNEKYELCSRVVKLLNKITNEKQEPRQEQ